MKKVIKDKKKIKELHKKVVDSMVEYGKLKARISEIAVLLSGINTKIKENKFRKFIYDVDYIGAIERNLNRAKDNFDKFVEEIEELINMLKELVR